MPGTPSRTAVATRRAVALAIAALVAVLLPVTTATATAKPDRAGGGPSPDPDLATTIRFDSVGEELGITTPGTKDLWYVVQGRQFGVALSFVDSAESVEPLSNNQTLTVTLKYGSKLLGTTAVAPGAVGADFPGVAIQNAASNIRLTVSVSTKPKALTVQSRQFDVLLNDVGVAVSGLTSIGDDGDGTAACVPAPATVCGDLLPPLGQNFGAGGLLSLGLCSGASCVDRYIQALVTTGEATPTNPATLVMKCDKDACGTGSIKRQKLNVTLAPGSLQPDDPLAVDYTAPACDTKGSVRFNPGDAVSSGNLPFCVDYVQSTRDNAGNTVLYLLFVDDAKVRFS